MTDMSEKIEALESAIEYLTTDEKIDRLSAEVEDMRNVLNAILGQISTVAESVGPVIDQLQANPMLRSFLGGK